MHSGPWTYWDLGGDNRGVPQAWWLGLCTCWHCVFSGPWYIEGKMALSHVRQRATCVMTAVNLQMPDLCAVMLDVNC